MEIAIGNVWLVKDNKKEKGKEKKLLLGILVWTKNVKKRKKEKRNMDGVQHLIEYLNCFIISDNIWKTDLTNLRC